MQFVTKHKLFFVLGGLVIIALLASGFYYLQHLNERYITLIETEVAALEATIERAAATMGEASVKNAEAHQLHLDIHAHLDAMADHHPAVGLTSFEDRHATSLQSAIDTLEQFLETHADLFVVIDEAAETHHTEQLAKNTSSGAQLFRKISKGINNTVEVMDGHMENVS